MLRFSGQNYAAMGSRWQDGPQETPPRPRVHRRAQGRGPSPQPLLRDQDAEARRTSRWSRAIEDTIANSLFGYWVSVKFITSNSCHVMVRCSS